MSSGKDSVVVVLLNLGYEASDEAVLTEMNRHNLRPATLAELLAFANQFHFPQRNAWIVALGSIWTDQSGGRSVVRLGQFPDYRGLDLLSYGRTEIAWKSDDCFLAARK